MADWSIDGPIRELIGGAWWSTDGPATDKSQNPEWFPVPQRILSEVGIGRDVAILLPILNGVDRGVGSDYAILEIKSAIVATETGLGIDKSTLGFKVYERGLGIDRGIPGLTLKDRGLGLDAGIVASIKSQADERAAGADRSTVRPGFQIQDRAAGSDRGDGGFKFQNPITVPVTISGNVLIPSWPRYIDAVGVGPGGGGASGNQVLADGKAAQPGGWASATWDRGETRNTWLNIAVSLGTPGVGAPRNVARAGTAGTNTTISVGGNTVTANGGAGGSGLNGIGSTDYIGKGPGNHTRNGVTYNGGGDAAKSQPGTFPGGAGAGGSGSGWPGNGQPGGNGGASQVWIRFWMD